MTGTPHRKDKICHLLLSLNQGGMENGVVNVSNTIAKNSDQFEQIIICIRSEGCLAKRLSSSIRVYCLNQKKGISLAALLKLKTILKNERVRILYTHNHAPLIWGGIVRLLLPGMKWIHGEHGFALKEVIYRWVSRWLIKKANLVTVVSENLLAETRHAYSLPSLVISVIPNGVNTTFYKPISSEKKKAFKNLRGISPDSFLLLCSGRLERRKNQQFAIRVIHELNNRRPGSCHLLLAGTGDDKGSLIRLTQELKIEKNVHFLGYRDDMPMIYGSSDILLLPSLWGEGMANAILEANACGIPVIASPLEGNLYVVEEGMNGFTREVSGTCTSLHWAQLIHRLINNPRELSLLKARSRKKMQKEFSLTQMVERYSEMYNNLALG